MPISRNTMNKVILASLAATLVLEASVVAVMLGSTSTFVPSTTRANRPESVSSGTIYYISSSEGNDANNGTSETSPWQSFQHVNINTTRFNLQPNLNTSGQPHLDWDGNPAFTWQESHAWGNVTLQPGDTIKLKAGDTWNEPLHLMGKGNDTHFITLTSYGDVETLGRPVISLAGKENDTGVKITNPSYWFIENLDLRNAKLGLYLHYYEDYNNREVWVENCHFQDIWSDSWDVILPASNYEYAWSTGLFLGGKAYEQQHATVLSGWTVRGCTFENNSHGLLVNWYWPAMDNHHRVVGLRIENNTARRCATGFAINHAGSGYIRRFHVFDGKGNYSCGTTGGFIQCSSNIEISGCIFAGTRREGVPDAVGFDFEGDARNITFHHNVIFDNDGGGIVFFETVRPSQDVRILNCLLYNNCRNPLNQRNAYELLNMASVNTGMLRNVRVFKGDNNNRETGLEGITIPGPGKEPESYTVGVVGPRWGDRDRWGNFNRKEYIAICSYDPAVDYTDLWPACVTADVACPPIDITDYLVFTIAGAVIAAAGAVAIFTCLLLRRRAGSPRD